MSTQSQHASDSTGKFRESMKGGLVSGEREERRNSHDVDGGGDEEGKSRDRARKEKNDERRPKIEREEPPAKRERHSERRFRDVNDRESFRDRDSSRNWRSSQRSERTRWNGDSDRSTKLRGGGVVKEQDQERAYGRGGRGNHRSFGGSRQGMGGRYFGGGGERHQGRHVNGASGDSRQAWGGAERYNSAGDRDSRDSYRRQSMTYLSKGQGERWQHDLFETIVNGTNTVEVEEDPVAKIEALLAS